MVLRSTFALLLAIQFASFFFFFFSATILSGPYLWDRYSQRLQIECAAWSCGLILHCCLPSNSLHFFFFFFFRPQFFFPQIFFFWGGDFIYLLFFFGRDFFFSTFFFFFFFGGDFFSFFILQIFFFFFGPRFFIYFILFIYSFFPATILSGPFASLISSLINIISLLLTTFDWTKVRGIALGRIQGDREPVSLSYR